MKELQKFYKTCSSHYGFFFAGVLLYAAAMAVLSLFCGAVHWSEVSTVILRYSRLPRTLGCLFAGAALSVSGAILQKVFGNPLASPNIIGVNAGAGFAITLCAAFFTLPFWGVSLAAFLGAFGAVLLILLLGNRTHASRTTVVLAGVTLNALLNAGSEALVALFPDVAWAGSDFRIGSFSSVSWGRLLPAMVLIAAALLTVWLLRNELDILSLGEETAHGLGISVRFLRAVFLILAALLAGAAVSFAGLLGFVGLLVPHLVRKFTGDESHRLLPICACFGGGFVAMCDSVSRLVFSPFEFPVGVLLSFIGGPAFFVILLKQKRGSAHD